MGTTITSKVSIKFSYKKDDLFENCSLKTAHISRYISENTAIVDHAIMQNDDRSLFDANLPEILGDIYEIFLKLTDGTKSSQLSDSDEISITIKDNEAYNKNVVELVDVALYNCLETGTIALWYEANNISTISKDYRNRYIVALRKLSDRIFQLKKVKFKNVLGTVS